MEDSEDLLIYFGDITTNRKYLFQDALLYAKFGKVLYIINEEIEELPKLSQDLCLISKHYMKMISFLYAKTLESLLETLSKLHEWQNIPCAIILDDITKFCHKEEVQRACGIVAFVIDTAQSCTAVSNVQCRLRIAVDETVGEDFYIKLKELYVN